MADSKFSKPFSKLEWPYPLDSSEVSGQSPTSQASNDATGTTSGPTFGNRGRGGRGLCFNGNPGFQLRFGSSRGGRVQFHMLNGENGN